MKKTNSELYYLLSDVLDCDYRRLVDAFDDMDGDILSEAIDEARDDNNITLGKIMSEAIDIAVRACYDNFENEKQHQMERYPEDSDEYELLESFDLDDLRDSVQFDDVLFWSSLSSSYSMEDMQKYVKLLPNSFSEFISLLGTIDGLPENE